MIKKLPAKLESKAQDILHALHSEETHTTAALFPGVNDTNLLLSLDTYLRKNAENVGLRLETSPEYADRIVGLPFHIPWIAHKID